MPTLLIVDDETDVCEFAKNFFTRRKIDVITARSGEEALKFLEQEKVNLVLLDIRMGGIDGVQVLEQMRKRGDTTDVIMVTGVNEDEAMEKTKKLGAIGYIHKPLVLAELEKVVMGRLVKK